MKSIKSLTFLLLFLSSTAFSSTTFASDKPVWTIDYKKLNLLEHGKPVGRDKWATMGAYDKPNPNYKVHFTPDNKILISFLEHRPLTRLGSNVPAKKFVVLLLSRENGDIVVNAVRIRKTGTSRIPRLA